MAHHRCSSNSDGPSLLKGRAGHGPLRGRAGHGPPKGRAGYGAGGAGHDSPTISPSSSRSIRAAAGSADRPGIVRMSPQIGYTNPAPAEARTSRTGSVHPVGAPLSAGSDEIDRCVLAMHTG